MDYKYGNGRIVLTVEDLGAGKLKITADEKQTWLWGVFRWRKGDDGRYQKVINEGDLDSMMKKVYGWTDWNLTNAVDFEWAY